MDIDTKEKVAEIRRLNRVQNYVSRRPGSTYSERRGATGR
jgi:hypothetical protein